MKYEVWGNSSDTVEGIAVSNPFTKISTTENKILTWEKVE